MYVAVVKPGHNAASLGVENVCLGPRQASHVPARPDGGYATADDCESLGLWIRSIDCRDLCIKDNEIGGEFVLGCGRTNERENGQKDSNKTRHETLLEKYKQARSAGDGSIRPSPALRACSLTLRSRFRSKDRGALAIPQKLPAGQKTCQREGTVTQQHAIERQTRPRECPCMAQDVRQWNPDQSKRGRHRTRPPAIRPTPAE